MFQTPSSGVKIWTCQTMVWYQSIPPAGGSTVQPESWAASRPDHNWILNSLFLDRLSIGNIRVLYACARLSAQLLHTTWQQTELQCDSDVSKLKEWSHQFEMYASKQALSSQIFRHFVKHCFHRHEPHISEPLLTSCCYVPMICNNDSEWISFFPEGILGLEVHQWPIPQGPHGRGGLDEGQARVHASFILGAGTLYHCAKAGWDGEDWVSQLGLWTYVLIMGNSNLLLVSYQSNKGSQSWWVTSPSGHPAPGLCCKHLHF